MSNLDQRDRLINELTVMSNKLEERWPNMTHAQASNFKAQIEVLWRILVPSTAPYNGADRRQVKRG